MLSLSLRDGGGGVDGWWWGKGRGSVNNSGWWVRIERVGEMEGEVR